VKKPKKNHTYFLAEKTKVNMDFFSPLKNKHTMKQENKRGRKKNGS
jgi:hypothetical protein